MTRKRWVIVAAALAVVVLVVAALVVTGVIGGDDAEDRARRARSADASFEEAAVLAPADAQRVLWTDWGGVRDVLGVELGATSSATEVQRLLDLGFDADLVSTTALDSSTTTLQESFGFSPATLEWEMFTQSERAATLTMRLGGGVSTDDVAAALRELGYTEPAQEDGVWLGDSNLAIAGQVSPELTNVALDADHGLVFASDQPAGVTVAVDAAARADAEPVPRGVVAGLGSPLTAAAYDATYACSNLAMANADPDAQAEAETLVAQAGQVNPVTGFAIGAEPDRGVRITMGFENDDQARTNADTRATLASGPAPGQGGSFTDRFALESVSAADGVVTMELDPVEGTFVVSELSNGPVLFATC